MFLWVIVRATPHESRDADEGCIEAGGTGCYHAGCRKVLQPNLCPAVGGLYAIGTGGGALISQQCIVAGSRELYPLATVETAHAVGVIELCLKEVAADAPKADAGGRSPLLGLVFKRNLVGDVLGAGLNGVVARL